MQTDCFVNQLSTLSIPVLPLLNSLTTLENSAITKSSIAKGGKAKVLVPSAIGYGARGSEPKIKPNQFWYLILKYWI